MKRNAIKALIKWKDQPLRTPLFLYGMKGCGKTYLALDFAKSFFEGSLYINLEQKTSLKMVLEAGCEKIMNSPDAAEEFFLLLSEAFDVPAEFLAGFLIVFDEVMASEPIYRMLLQFSEEEWQFCLLAITSHTPVFSADYAEMNRNGTARLQLLKLFPLQFDEYLQAIGSEWYAEVIKGHYQTNHKIPGIVHNELLELFEDYLKIGGMPAAVNEYQIFNSADNVAEIHKNLYGMLSYHIQSNYEESLALKMKQVIEVVPEQLAKENQKFQYKLIRKGATFALYQQAIQTLLQDSILICCSKTGEANSFKLFPPDVGMYYSMAGQELQNGCKKELLDCYVMQALTARGYKPCFWESASQARIDFILQREEGMIPVEVKTSDNARSKSVSIYRNEFHIPYSIKISSRNFEFVNQIKYIPYYAIFCL